MWIEKVPFINRLSILLMLTALANPWISDAVQVPQPGMVKIQIMTQVSGVNVHRVPLHRNEEDGEFSRPYCYAVSSPLDEKIDNFLATQVWPSARTAAMALEQNLLKLDENIQSVCEFGCGPGLPSLAAATILKERQQQNKDKSWKPRVYATDLDEYALKLVAAAASEQDLSSIVTTRRFDLVESDSKEIPDADLYVLSDVFESSAVAQGAAKLVSQILKKGDKNVWVFCQSDRAQRDVFLRELRYDDSSLSWEAPNKQLLAPMDNKRDGRLKQLWLCEIDETNVIYG